MSALTKSILSHVQHKLDSADPTLVARISPFTIQSIRNYILLGIPPSWSLEKILENDLAGAVSNADKDNSAALADIVRYLMQSCPSRAVLHQGAVREWLQMHRERKAEAAEKAVGV